ncbi:hypothetical protein CF641_17575 [Burkholderia pseudomallei]|nr:hypothetical protein CF641_17575 [Burkholderia pseudomallei]PNX40049.1 hypothetical protein CF642_18425 [Burkholderia pseudomallei]
MSTARGRPRARLPCVAGSARRSSSFLNDAVNGNRARRWRALLPDPSGPTGGPNPPGIPHTSKRRKT